MLPRFPKSENDFSSTKAEAKLKCLHNGKLWCDQLSENNLLTQILDQTAKGSRKKLCCKMQVVIKWRIDYTV